MEGRGHSDGRFKLAVEARQEHVGLLFGNGKRIKGSRNTREGKETSHHDIAVSADPVTDIVTTHEGEVRRPLGMHRNISMGSLVAIIVSGEGFPHFPGTTIETTALTVHFDTVSRILVGANTVNITGVRAVTRVSHEERLVLGPGVCAFPNIAAVQTVVESNHVLTRIDLTMLGILEVKVTTVEARFQLEVDTGHVRGVAESTCVEVGFVLAPARETGRVRERIRRIETRLEEHEFSSHRPTFDILALGLDIKTELRGSHARTVAFLICGIALSSINTSKRINGIIISLRIRNKHRGIRNANAHISHQVEFRGNVALHINRSDMSIEEGRETNIGISSPLRTEFRFEDGTLIIGNAHVVHTDGKVISNLFLGDTAMEDRTTEIVTTGHFEFARLTTVHAETVTSCHVSIDRLGNEELSLHVIRELVDVRKDTTEGAVRPECTTTFLDRLECLFLIVGRNGLFVFEEFVLPNETRVGFTFPHGKRRSVCPDNTACGNIGTEHTGTDIDTDVQFFVDGRTIVVGRVVKQDAFIVGISRRLGRILCQVVRINTAQVEREHEVRKQRNVGVRHSDDIDVQDSVDACASLVITDPRALFGIVEILQTESHITGDCQWQIVLAEKSRFHIVGKSIQRSVKGIKLQLRRKSPCSTEARR